MIIKASKLKEQLTGNNYSKSLASFFKLKSSSTDTHSPLSYTTYPTTINDTSINRKTNSFSFLTSNFTASEKNSHHIIIKERSIHTNGNLPSLNPIKEERRFDLLKEYSIYEQKQRSTTAITNRQYRITNKNEDSFYSRHKSNSRINKEVRQFPKKIFIYHDNTQCHDVNLLNKRYLERDPNENYSRNSYKLKKLVLSRAFVDEIKSDITRMKYNNQIKVILS